MWFDDRYQQHLIQLNEVTEFPYNDTYICAYVKIEYLAIQHMRDKFLRSIGGQIHVQFEEHRMPLIALATYSDHCSECGITDYM